MAPGRHAAIALCALPFALAPVAAASSTQESLVQDDDMLMYNGPQVADRTFDELAALGVDRVRLTLHWGNVAPERREDLRDPADPAGYDAAEFDGVDHAVRAARARGIRVLLTVTGPAPAWAVPRRPGPGRRAVHKPKPAAYARFVEMVGRRWSGEYRDENQGGDVLPRVDAWSTWNEPNWQTSLMPQWGRDGRRRKVPMAARTYRRLHRAAVAGLERSGHGGDQILLGETAPLGSKFTRRRSPLKPLVFLRELFCLRRDLRPWPARAARRRGCDYARRGALRATGYAHHPYPIKRAPWSAHPDPDRATLADSERLAAVLDAAAAAGRIPAGLPLWFTEFGWQTEPDPFRGIGLARHARWIAAAERLAWDDPRVAVHGQFLLRDDEPRTQFPPGSGDYWATWQSGLLFADGGRKPAYDAYRLPFVAPRRAAAGAPLELWGLVRPAQQGAVSDVTIEWRPAPDAAWEAIVTLQVTDAHGAFGHTVAARGGDYRFVWRPPAPPPEPPLVPLLAPAQPPPPEPVASAVVHVTVE